MNDLIAFVEAQLDDWERRGRQAEPFQTGSRDEGQPPEHVSWRRGPGSVEFGLRHVATLRAVLAEAKRAAASIPTGHRYDFIEFTLRTLAADWPTHRDYRDTWKPGDCAYSRRLAILSPRPSGA